GVVFQGLAVEPRRVGFQLGQAVLGGPAEEPGHVAEHAVPFLEVLDDVAHGLASHTAIVGGEKGTGTVVRSTLRAGPATVPVPLSPPLPGRPSGGTRRGCWPAAASTNTRPTAASRSARRRPPGRRSAGRAGSRPGRPPSPTCPPGCAAGSNGSSGGRPCPRR